MGGYCDTYMYLRPTRNDQFIAIAVGSLLVGASATSSANDDPLAAVPIIDLAADRATASSAVSQALQRFGFFYVTNHGVSPRLIDVQFEQSRALFSLPLEVKQEMPFNSTLDVGWYGAGFQALDEEMAIGDTKESYLLCNNAVFDADFVMNQGDPLAGSELRLPPKELLPDYEPTMREYARAITGLNHDLNRLLFDAPFTPVKQLKYAAAAQLESVHEQALGAGEHADWGALTLLATDGTPGLQVQLADGAWIDVPPIDGALIVNAGDQIEQWTNGHFRSANHRVVMRSAAARYSTAFFTYFSWHALVEALPQFVSAAHPALRPPETTGEYFAFKLKESIDAAAGGAANGSATDEAACSEPQRPSPCAAGASTVLINSSTGRQLHIPIVPLMEMTEAEGASDDDAIAAAWGSSMARFGLAFVCNAPVQAAAHELERAARRFFAQPQQAKREYQVTEHYWHGYGIPGQIAVSRALSFSARYAGGPVRARSADAVETVSLPASGTLDGVHKEARRVIPNPALSEGTCWGSGGHCPSYEDGGALLDGVTNYRRVLQATLLPKALAATTRYFELSGAYFNSTAGGFYGTGAGDGRVGSVDGMDFFGRVALNHYVPRWQDDQLEYAEHTDSSMFTFVRRSAPNVLQFLFTDIGGEEEWIGVPYHPDLLVVNAGDTVERLTNGRWRAVPHRVGSIDSGGVGKEKQIGSETPLTMSLFVQPHDAHPLDPWPSRNIDPVVLPELLPRLTAAGLRDAKTKMMR